MGARPPAVLFDLDGVLADSRETITRSIQAAFVAQGHEPPDDDAVLEVIGPPSRIAFGRLLGADPESPVVEACVTDYRDRYATALRDTTTFPGVPEAVAELRRDFALGVATSKPARFAGPVLEAIGLRDAFDVVAGPELTGTEGKSATVAQALERLPGAVAMVGDRATDLLAAHEHGLLAVGVTWGFGSVEELRDAGPDALVDQPAGLVAVLREAATRARFDTSSCTTGP